MSKIISDTIQGRSKDPNVNAGLTIAGVTTATGVINASSDVRISGNLNAGIVTVTSISGNGSGLSNVGVDTATVDASTLQISGISTFKNELKVTAGGIEVDSGGLDVAGVGTFAANINANGDIVGDNSTNILGISSVTATTFYGGVSGLTGTLPALDGSNLTGIAGGITDFDRWHLTADTTGNTNPIQNNWSRWTSYGGTGTVTFAAPSSGIWTFPSTGFWHIDWFGMFHVDNKAERGCNLYIYNTTSDGTQLFVTAAETSAHDSSAITKTWSRCTYIFDVTNTSTHKVSFAVGYNQSSNSLLGHGSYLYSNVCFTKLRDT